MKEVVLNKCYGGFGLSLKACIRYAELSGITLYPALFDREKHIYYPCTASNKFDLVFYFKKPIDYVNSIDDNDKWNEDIDWEPRRIDRDDPILVQVVKELDEEANGHFAELRIVEIPDDIEFEIEEYDGIEKVCERHREWG